MQLAPSQLGRHVERGLKSLYTMHGDEPLLQQEALDALRAHARTQGFTERSAHMVSGAHFDWSEVLAAGGSMSLFADKQILKSASPAASRAKKAALLCSRSPSRRRAMMRC